MLEIARKQYEEQEIKNLGKSAETLKEEHSF